MAASPGVEQASSMAKEESSTVAERHAERSPLESPDAAAFEDRLLLPEAAYASERKVEQAVQSDGQLMDGKSGDPVRETEPSDNNKGANEQRNPHQQGGGQPSTGGESRPKRSYLSSKKRTEVDRWLSEVAPARGFACTCMMPEPWAANGFGWKAINSLDGIKITESSPSLTSNARPQSSLSLRQLTRTGTPTAAEKVTSRDGTPSGATRASRPRSAHIPRPHLLRDRISKFFRRARPHTGSGKAPSAHLDADGELIPGAIGNEWDDEDDQEDESRPYCAACGLPINGLELYHLSEFKAGSIKSFGANATTNREGSQLNRNETTKNGDNDDDDDESNDDDDKDSANRRKPPLALDASAARLRRAEKLLKKTTSSHHVEATAVT